MIRCYTIRRYTMSVRMISIGRIVGSISGSIIFLQQLGSIYFLCMANMNAWWSSQLICTKSSDGRQPVMPQDNRKWNGEKFLVP